MERNNTFRQPVGTNSGEPFLSKTARSQNSGFKKMMDKLWGDCVKTVLEFRRIKLGWSLRNRSLHSLSDSVDEKTKPTEGKWPGPWASHSVLILFRKESFATHTFFFFLEQSKYDFIWKYLSYTHIPGKIPVYNEEQWLMEGKVNLCGTTFIYVALNLRTADTIPQPEQFSCFLLTSCVWNRYILWTQPPK